MPRKKRSGVQERVTDETSNEEFDLETGATTAVAERPALGAATGRGGIGLVIDPKLRKIQADLIGPDGQVRRVRFDAGKLYVLPRGCQWALRPPVGIVTQELPDATPVDLDAIRADVVTRHRLVVVQPRLAKAQAYLGTVLGAEQAALIAAQGAEALIATYNEVQAAHGGTDRLAVPSLVPGDPAGVRDIPAAMAERMRARLAPPEPATVSDDIFAALGQGAQAAPAEDASAED